MQIEYKKGKYSISMDEPEFHNLVGELKFYIEILSKDVPLRDVLNKLLPSSALVMALGESIKEHVKEDPKMNYKVKNN